MTAAHNNCGKKPIGLLSNILYNFFVECKVSFCLRFEIKTTSKQTRITKLR
jgi:hypothetical protein